MYSVCKNCLESLSLLSFGSLSNMNCPDAAPPNATRGQWSVYGLCKRHHKCTNIRCGCLFNRKGRGQMHLWNEMDLPNRRPQAEIGLHWVICKLLATRREEESVRNVILPVLLVNVGPETFGNLSDICQKYVRKLSVTKMSQKRVINVRVPRNSSKRHASHKLVNLPKLSCISLIAVLGRSLKKCIVQLQLGEIFRKILQE